MPPAAEIVRRLIDAGLLSTRDVVDGTLTVVDLSRSNPVWLVDAGAGGRYVAKVTAAERDDQQGSGAVEALLYERVAADPGLAAVAPVPALVTRLDDLLVLAPVGDGEGLAQRLRDKGATSADGRLLGDALGRWRAVAGRLAGDGLPGCLPWALVALAEERPAFLDEHPATRRLGDLLRGQRELHRALDAAAGAWRRETVVHGDVRWDNVVVAVGPDGGGERLLFVDLEFADWGDPAWDVAGAVAEPLAVAATTGAGDDETGFVVTDLRTAGRYVRQVRSFLACFAAAYREGAGPGADEDLRRGMAFVPARLVQAAFQHAAWNPATGVAAGLAAAGLAAAFDGAPHLLGGTLSEPTTAAARRVRGLGP